MNDTALEGDAIDGPQTFTFEVSTSGLVDVDLLVDYATADGTATSSGVGAGDLDYDGLLDTVTILSGEGSTALWVPVGFAHGFVALEDDSYVWYKCTAAHAPEAERSLRYSDPSVGVEWPIKPTIISPKDADAPLLADAEYDFAHEG